MDAFDDEEYAQAIADLQEANQRIDVGPTKAQRLGGFTVVCLVLNRTIGSGIFVTPAKVWIATGSVGASLLIWAAGGLITTCGLLVWLELGLSVPLRTVPGTNEVQSVPRSGGEKNYIEFMFPKPKFLATSMYGILFIILGNLSGNALAFGQYIMHAAAVPSPAKGQVIGLAVGALSVCILLHMCSRRGGILLNNIFAGYKVTLLLVIIIIGLVKGSRHQSKSSDAFQNLSTNESFTGSSSNVANYVDSFVYVIYSYSGFEQPFAVLSEVSQPRRNFPKHTLLAMAIAIFLFIMTNVAYFMVVAKLNIIDGTDIATAMLGDIFDDVQAAQRAMAALIAIAIFGNILVMTFTASRIKQELAKEGILPFSLFFATCYTTPFAKFRAWLNKESRISSGTVDDHLEQTPIPALALHWFSSVMLIAVTSMLTPTKAYSVLVSLYSYVIIIGMGFIVSGGLLYMSIFGVPREALPIELETRRKWSLYRSFRPWISPLHALVYFLACGFVLFASFVKPSVDSPYYSARSSIQWFIVPTIGQSAWLWGIIWFLGLHAIMWHVRKWLSVRRIPYITPDEDDPDEWVQRSELINHEWHVMKRKKVGKNWEAHEMT